MLGPDDPALADILSVRVDLPALRRARRIVYRTAALQHPLQPIPAPVPTNSLSSPSPKTDLAVIDGVDTLKRRAESTEIELVAALHDVEETSSSVAIAREGSVLPDNARRLA